MNDSHRRRLERLIRSEAEASANAADFPEASKGALALVGVRAAIAEVQMHAVSRETSVSALQQATIGRKDAREAVRASMRIISDTARTIGLDHPEIRGIFVFKGVSVGDRTLLATAQSFAAKVQSFKTLFGEYDLNADFFNNFGVAINNLEKQLGKQTVGKGERISANASLETSLRKGETALERLNTAARNKYRDDPAKLAAWERAWHLERAARPKRNGGGQKDDGGSQTPQS